MQSLMGRRDTSSEGEDSSEDDQRDLGEKPLVPTSGPKPVAKRQHDFLRTTNTSKEDQGDEDDEGKILSRYQRVTNSVDDNAPVFIASLGKKDFRKANDTWKQILEDMEYVFTTGEKFPYNFLSALQNGCQYFEDNNMDDLREEAQREQKKSLTDLQRSLSEYSKKYATQIENMDEDSENDDDDLVPKAGEGLSVFKEGEEVNEETVAKKIQEVLNSRGKKGTDKQLYGQVLLSLLSRCDFSPRAKAYVCSLLIAYSLDGPRKGSAFSPTKWNRTAEYLTILIDLLEAHPTEVIEEDVSKSRKKAVAADVPENPFLLTSSVSALSSRMFEEYLEGVRSTEIFTETYVQWLRAESVLLIILQRAMNIYNTPESITQAATIAANIMELIYYRKEEIHAGLMKKYGLVKFGIVTEDLGASVLAVNGFLQKNATTPDAKFVSVLSVVYHLAEHLKVTDAQLLFTTYKCPDLVLTSTDNTARVLYNRCLAQISIALFRTGNIGDAGITINNLYSLPRYKELLAQASERRQQADTRIEKLIRGRFVPCHMHVNTEVTDAIFFLYCMLFVDNRGRRDNKVFRNFVTAYERQHFLGPPENSRERVFAALIAFRKADWFSCQEHIRNITCWAAFGEKRDFLKPLFRIVKVECLRNFLTTNRGSYANVSLAHLAEKFDLDLTGVRNTVTRMVLQKDISGILDEAEVVLHIDNTQYTTVQQAALNVADKAILLTDFTERVQDQRSSTQEGGPGGAPGAKDRRAGTTRAPVARQLSARNPFSSLRGVRTAPGASTRPTTGGNWNKK
jgi:translation initiation factor 3 subunit C